MRNLIGLLLIIGGFIAPHLAGVQFSPLFFWPGFFILLSGMPLSQKGISKGWARIGLLFNILVSIFAVVLELRKQTSLVSKLYFILSPAGLVIQFLFPEKLPVEKFEYGDLRGTIITFFNIIIYVCLGVIIGKIINFKTKQPNQRTF